MFVPGHAHLHRCSFGRGRESDLPRVEVCQARMAKEWWRKGDESLHKGLIIMTSCGISSDKEGSEDIKGVRATKGAVGSKA